MPRPLPFLDALDAAAAATAAAALAAAATAAADAAAAAAAAARAQASAAAATAAATAAAAAAAAAKAAAAARFARLSASRPAAPLSAFCGGSHDTTLLSVCAHALLPLLPSRALLALRAACRDSRAAVAAHPLEDAVTPLKCASLRQWHACFPLARAARCTDLFAFAQPPSAEHCAALRGLGVLHAHLLDAAQLEALQALLPGVAVVLHVREATHFERRMTKELVELEKLALPPFTARVRAPARRRHGPGVSPSLTAPSLRPTSLVYPHAQPFIKGELHHWSVTVSGPAGSPYAGGSFHFDLTLPESYPFIPPRGRLTTTIFHPSFNDRGEFFAWLRDWGPKDTMVTALQSLHELLASVHQRETWWPCCSASALLVSGSEADEAEFVRRARECTLKYATTPT
jgi:ubiquitin-conjugating enzyme E2 D/E